MKKLLFCFLLLTNVTFLQAMESEDSAGVPKGEAGSLDKVLLELLSPQDFAIGNIALSSEDAPLRKAEKLIEGGADVSDLVDEAVRIYGQGYMIPLIWLLEKGASLNAANNAGEFPIERLFSQLPVYVEGVAHTMQYIASDWRRSTREYDRHKPMWLDVWTRYPRGPFLAHPHWHKQRALSAEHVEIVRREIFNWLLDQGVVLNVVRQDKKTMLMNTISKYLVNEQSNGDPLVGLSLQHAIHLLLEHGATVGTNPSEEVQQHIAQVYSEQPICQDIILNRQTSALEKLEPLFRLPEQRQYVEFYFTLAVGQNRAELVDAFIEKIGDSLSGACIGRALRAVAGTGNLDIFKKLMGILQAQPNSRLDVVVNFCYVRAAAQGVSSIVAYILENADFVDTLTAEILGEAIMRAAREGHQAVCDVLYHYFSTTYAEYVEKKDTLEKMVDECSSGKSEVQAELKRTVKTLTSMTRVFERAFLMAVINRQHAIVKLLLVKNLYSSRPFNYREIGIRLRNILRNPSLTPQVRREYESIMEKIKNHFNGRIALDRLVEDPERAEAYLTSLPNELLTYVMFFL